MLALNYQKVLSCLDIPSKPFVLNSHPALRSGVDAKGQNQLMIYEERKLEGLHLMIVGTDINTPSHPLSYVRENANIIRKLLLLDADLDSSGAVEVATKHPGSSNKSLMPLNLP